MVSAEFKAKVALEAIKVASRQPANTAKLTYSSEHRPAKH